MEDEYTVRTVLIASAAFGATVCAAISASREAEFETFECDTVEFEMAVDRRRHGCRV